MSAFKKFMDWRDEKMNGPRRDAEAEARAEGKSETEIGEAGKVAERRRRLRASFGSFLGG